MSEQRLKDLYQSASTHRETAAGDCTVSPEMMIDVIEGNVSGAARERTMLAIMSNPACHREFELLRALVEQAPEVVEPSAARQSGIPIWPMRIAASIVLVAGAALLWRALPGPDTARDNASAPVQLIVPTRGDAGSRFIWHSVPRALHYEYNLVGDGGRVVFSIVQTDTSVVLPDSVSVSPVERLRWWVEAVTADGIRVRSTLRDVRMNTP